MRARAGCRRVVLSLIVGVIMLGVAVPWAAAGEGAASRVGVAVLPFVAAEAETTEGLGIALAVALREGLEQVRGIRVVDPGHLAAALAQRDLKLSGPLPDAALAGLARDLKVRAVTAGSYTLQGDGVAVRVRLVEAAGKPADLGAEEQTVPLAAIETAQAKLARRIVAALRVKPSDYDTRRLDALLARPAAPPAAYVPYARGRWQQGLGTREAHEQALVFIGQALEADPNFARAHFAQGLSLYATNNRWKASGALRKALQLDPDFAAAYRWLGDLLVTSPRRLYDQAVQAYQKALDLAPDMAEAYVGMGDARQAKGQFDEALQEYKKALSLEPDNARVHFGMGKIYYQEKQQYHEAVAEYQRAVQIDPGFLEAHLSLGELYEEKGLYKDAVNRYRHVLELEPKHPGASFALARAYESIEPAQAVQQWERYLELATNLPSEKEWVDIARKHLNKLRRESK